jgi:hypothetical protein
VTSSDEPLAHRTEGPAAAATADGSAAAHRHRWSGVGFEFRDDHPWFLLRCDCGVERSIRAWERYSEPDPDPPADEPIPAVEG